MKFLGDVRDETSLILDASYQHRAPTVRQSIGCLRASHTHMVGS